MVRFFFLCVVLANSGLAQSTPEVAVDFQALRDGDLLNTPPAVFSSKETITFLPQIPKVNVITGEYCDEECDLVVAGIEPLSINRFYNHLSGIYHHLHGHWRLNPEAFMLFNFESVGGCHIFTAVGESNSSFFVYEQPISNGFQIDAGKNKSFTNIASLPSGQNHPLNTKVTYSKGYVHRTYGRSLRLDEDHYWWEGKIKDGSGRERIFKTDVRQWPQAGKSWPCRRSRRSGEITKALLDFAAPYQAQITEERKPNGNVIRYEYEDINASNQLFDHDLPTTYVLKAIRAYSQKGILLGAIDVSYARGTDPWGRKPSIWHDQIVYTGSDGRKATCFHQQRPVNKSNCFDAVLHHVEAAGEPAKAYTTQWESKNHYYDLPYIMQAGSGAKCLLETSYDPKTKKVTIQSAPVGHNGQMAPIARYEYQSDHTSVYDGENNKVIYRYNGDKRITSVEKYQGNQLYSVERNEWDNNTGNLLRQKIEDASGKSFYVLEFAYDERHNPIAQRVSHTIQHSQGQDVIWRAFSNDGFNLKLSESDRPGKEIKYTYLPNTNLLTSELVYCDGQICKRSFHFYDQELGSVCIKTIVDDGKSTNPDDLTGITFRKIVNISPKRSLSCIGLPETVEEKTIDQSGNEILLHKIIYTYHPSGKISREDHYDSNHVYRYSLINEYDAQERLISTTDALGNKTTFTYDANFNLISQSGPRSDMHKEWTYDAANRPIQEKEWQTDGTILITEKQYDKTGRVIATIDACGFETHYDHDALGRAIAIHHPDGSYEKKEYDVLGNVIQERDGNGYITKKIYNFRCQPVAIYYPDGTEEHFTYNDNSCTLATHVDTTGVKKVYTYDLLGNSIKTETYASGGALMTTVSATYAPFRKLSETDAEGNTTYFSYDFAGRKIFERKGEKLVTYYYDELGRLSHTKENDRETHIIYDLNGQVLEKRIEGQKLSFQETYAYDESGNRTAVTTCAGTSKIHYNSRKEPIRLTDPLGNTTALTYSYHNGFTKTIIDPKGIQTIAIHDSMKRPVDLQVKNKDSVLIQREEKKYDLAGNQTHTIEYVYEGSILREKIVHEWSYGPKSRVERLLEAGEKETRYLYDASGRLKTLIKPDGEEIHRDYDGLSRLSRYYGKGIDYRYFYDLKNRLLKIEERVHNTVLERYYDIYDHLIKEKLDSGIVISSNFDPYGRRTTLHLPDGSQASYRYDGPYLYSVERNGLFHTYAERNLAGKPTTIILPDKSTTSITYDPLLRWKNYQSPHFKAEYSYDEIGNLTQYSFVDGLGKESCVYSYDDLNQLISEKDHQYTYDSLYNRRAKDDNPYSINSLCQITHDGQRPYAYDKNGNLLSDGESTYEYDVLDRLISVTKNGKPITFVYDAFNRRIAKNNDLYIWDDKKEIGMIRDGKVKELRILGEGLGAEIGAAAFYELNETTYFPIHDHRGSLITLLSSKDSITYRYSAFGEQLTDNILSPWRFASKRHDEETGFVYFGRRYYSPDLGRWITADPNGFKDGPNLYAYVKNSPLLTIDLYGLEGRYGGWESFKGGCRATFDYFYDGFCRFGSWMDSRMRTGYEMQWRTISDPIGHGKWMWDTTSNFARQIPKEMNLQSFKSGCIGAATSCFPKTAKALSSSNQSLDDYSRAYISQQATLEIATFFATMALAEATTAEKIVKCRGGILTDILERNMASKSIVGGGAELKNLSTSDIKRIQNAANRTNQEIIIIGSRASGTASATSDWDYIMSGKSSQRHSASSSVPRGISGGAIDARGCETGIDIWQSYNPAAREYCILNENLPHIIFKPE